MKLELSESNIKAIIDLIDHKIWTMANHGKDPKVWREIKSSIKLQTKGQVEIW